MSEDIELGVTDRTPLLRSRVHSGYGASKLPITPTAAGGFAGSAYDHIFASQLGKAADYDWFGIKADQYSYYDKIPWDLKKLPLAERRAKVKPYALKWNKETREKYPEHWRLIRPKKNQEEKVIPTTPRGEPKWYGQAPVLPLSQNIGPGNPVRPATNAADTIAQGHDLHYKYAKKDSEVLSADREAISQFAYESIHGKDPVSQIHAAIGTIGLGTKHIIESAIGKPIYGKLCLKDKDLWALIQRIDLIGKL